MKLRIRKSTPADMEGILSCYDAAKRYMREHGNHSQWTNGYPSRDVVAEDIAAGNSYVGLDGQDEIVMTFAFIIGDDPTYSVIEDGRWPDARPYGTIHRIGSNGKRHGILRDCVEFCMSKIDTIRLDTHADNITMQKAAEKLGFKRCGIIICRDGTPRIAYQK